MEFALLRHWRQSRLENYPDAVLCEECLAGNEEAWVALLGRYQNLIYSIPLKFHFHEDEAADITGLSPGELRGRSFLEILKKGRK